MLCLFVIPLLLGSCYAANVPGDPLPVQPNNRLGNLLGVANPMASNVRDVDREKVAPSGCCCCGDDEESALGKFFKRLSSKKNVDTMLNAAEAIGHVAQGVVGVIAIVVPPLSPAMAAAGMGLVAMDNMLERLEKDNDERHEEAPVAPRHESPRQ